MIRRLLILFLIAFSTNYTIAQKLANNWYFGINAGLSFENGSAVAVLNGQLNTREGCASISSTVGDLLFYTDGTQVWNSIHEQMPNGYDLKGHIGSTQSAIIVSKPGSDNLYYIFTIDAVEHNNGENGINYSLVDISLEGGMGDVATEKNINLAPNLCEKVTSVAHFNGEDTWVITQKWNTNHIYAYLVSDQGVDPTPIISEAGQLINTIYNAVGYMKVSPEGGTLVKANSGLYSVEIFDFNNATGMVDNPREIQGFTTRPYGIEFSPNGRLLYVNAENDSDESLFQYDLNAGSIEDIIASEIVVANMQTSGALQLGPDNRIYVGNDGASTLSRINYPNKQGHLCNFDFEAVDLGGRKIVLGLPTFVQSYFAAITADFNFANTCFGETTEFYDNSSQEPDSLLWNFGDPASGTDNISILNNPIHIYGSPANYDVLLTVWKEEIESEISYTVDVTAIPIAFAGDDQVILYGSSTTLNGLASSGVQPYNYLWEPTDKLVQDNIPDPETVALFASTVFTLFVTDSKNCIAEPSEVLINVSTGEVLAAFPIASPDTVCRGETVNISANAIGGSGSYDYLWTSNPPGFSSTEPSFTIVPNQSATYLLNLKDSFDTTLEDSVQLTVKISPILDIIPDGIEFIPPNTIVVCVRDSVFLDAGSDLNPEGISYNWNNTGLNQRYLIALSNGSWIEVQKHAVEVTIDENNCSASDSITIIFDFNECEIGIEENSNENPEINIYPNPNSGRFNLSLNADFKDFELKIMDVNGKKIFDKVFEGNYTKGEKIVMDIEFLAKGIYFFILTSNKKQHFNKVIIQ